MSEFSDERFPDAVAAALADLPAVEAVALGGSRAQGTNRPDSDWDFAIYYRAGFTPESVRRIGWPGELTEIGGWGPFNGGGHLIVDGRSLDLHYRDMSDLERVHDAAERGEFRIDFLLFHQAGLPSYIVLAELAVNRVLVGEAPRWDYPDALRAAAPARWWSDANLTLHYAREGHARHGRTAQCAGLLSQAACQTAHAILASRGEWVTNEKRMLARAGLTDIDGLLAGLGTEPASLTPAADAVRASLERAVAEAGIRS